MCAFPCVSLSADPHAGDIGMFCLCSWASNDVAIKPQGWRDLCLIGDNTIGEDSCVLLALHSFTRASGVGEVTREQTSLEMRVT